AVHGSRLQGARGEAIGDPGGDPRRRHRAAPDRRAPDEPALLPADRGVREPDGRARRPQHVVQRERADRDDTGRGGRHLPEAADGPARPWQPRGAQVTAVLFTCAGQRVDIVTAFGRAGSTTVAADANPLAPALYHADHHALVPRVTAPDYVPALAELVRE